MAASMGTLPASSAQPVTGTQTATTQFDLARPSAMKPRFCQPGKQTAASQQQAAPIIPTQGTMAGTQRGGQVASGRAQPA
eukprot:2071716-Alexandrium_andersonii.AAC.1